MRTYAMVVAVVVCVLVGSVAVAQSIVADSDTFPVAGGDYVSANGTTYGIVPTEMVALELSYALPGNTLPVLNKSIGESFQVDSFFDVFTELIVDGGTYHIDSFFDVFFDITVTDVDGVTGDFQAEIVEMSLSGDIAGMHVEIRESPTLSSNGPLAMTDLGDGTFQVDSFFDVFTELSVDGGPWVPADIPIRMDLPEPATSVLLLLGMAGVLRRRRTS